MKRGRKISIPGPWVAHRLAMLESPAYQTLSLSAHRALARIEIEHCHHGGQENGKLPVTFDDFERYGISEKSVAPALRELEALGFIKITQRGRPSKSDFVRHPNRFELTYIAAAPLSEPLDDWNRFASIEEAEFAARGARAAKNPGAVAKSKRIVQQKADIQGENICGTGSRNHPGSLSALGSENNPTVREQEMTLLSISRSGRPVVR
jgi:hypothetical protein